MVTSLPLRVMNDRYRRTRSWWAFLSFSTWLILSAGAADQTPAAADPERTALAVEALSRLQNVDLESNPKLKEAVLRVLAATHGTPAFVRLVKQFKVVGQAEGLLETAAAHPQDESGVEAVRLLLQQRHFADLQTALTHTNAPRAVAIATALGNTGDKDSLPLLLPAVTNGNVNSLVRKQAVRGLAQTQDGARALLSLAEANTLPEPLKFTASSELSQARWPEIKASAARLLPLPQGQDAQPLPPVSELVKRKGAVAHGEEVFRSPATTCAKCHQVKGVGTEIGPNLSEIGSKLGKDALYESILDPSAGISFGFEAWQLELNDNEEAYGLIVSETADEVAVKDLNGIISRYKKSALRDRRQMKLSLMPAGLQQIMSAQDLVDLVEYLASLKKADNPK